MAAGTQACGYEYMALTDHSRRLTMAHGLDPARVARQIREIDKLNAKLKGFTVLKGIEVDILKDGQPRLRIFYRKAGRSGGLGTLVF